MYFTICPDSKSTPSLTPEAQDAHQRLRGHALALAILSADCALDAQAAVDSYRAALAAGSPEPWQPFVAAVASLVRHSAVAFPTLSLGARERAAEAYFAQILHENADLLEPEALAVV
jgi:hypothetical protein